MSKRNSKKRAQTLSDAPESGAAPEPEESATPDPSQASALRSVPKCIERLHALLRGYIVRNRTADPDRDAPVALAASDIAKLIFSNFGPLIGERPPLPRLAPPLGDIVAMCDWAERMSIMEPEFRTTSRELKDQLDTELNKLQRAMTKTRPLRHESIQGAFAALKRSSIPNGNDRSSPAQTNESPTLSGLSAAARADGPEALVSASVQNWILALLYEKGANATGDPVELGSLAAEQDISNATLRANLTELRNRGLVQVESRTKAELTPLGVKETEQRQLASRNAIEREYDIRRRILKALATKADPRPGFYHYRRMLRNANVTEEEFDRNVEVLLASELVRNQYDVTGWYAITPAGQRAIGEAPEDPPTSPPESAQPGGVVLAAKGPWASRRNGKILRGERKILRFLDQRGYRGSLKLLNSAIVTKGCPVTKRGQGKSSEADEGELDAWLKEHLDALSVLQSTSANTEVHRRQIDQKTTRRSDRSGKPVSLEAEGLEIKPRRSTRKRRGR